MYFNVIKIQLSAVVMADTGAGPSQERRKLNEEELKAKRERERQRAIMRVTLSRAINRWRQLRYC